MTLTCGMMPQPSQVKETAAEDMSMRSVFLCQCYVAGDKIYRVYISPNMKAFFID